MQEGAVDMAEALQIVLHLLLLGSKLVGIVEILPTTAATSAKMRALEWSTFGGELLDANNTAFGKVLLFLYYFDVGNIARYHKGDKHNHAVDFGDGFAFGADIGNEDVLDDGLFLRFTHFHNGKDG